MNTEGIKKSVSVLGKTLKKASPTILTCLGVAGVVSTAVMAVRATPKALLLIEQERDFREEESEDGYIEDLTKMDIIKATWKCYVPATIMGGVTVACIVCANSINLKRNAALAGVYSLAETTLKEYQAEVIEAVGEEKAKEIRDRVVQKKIDNNPISSNETIILGTGESLCYEVISGRYFKCDMQKLRSIENDINLELINNMYASLNDLYYELGLENTKLGDDMGWSITNGKVKFSFGSHLTKEGIPCISLDYSIDPQYNYND